MEKYDPKKHVTAKELRKFAVVDPQVPHGAFIDRKFLTVEVAVDGQDGEFEGRVTKVATREAGGTFRWKEGGSE